MFLTILPKCKASSYLFPFFNFIFLFFPAFNNPTCYDFGKMLPIFIGIFDQSEISGIFYYFFLDGIGIFLGTIRAFHFYIWCKPLRLWDPVAK